MSQLPLKNAKAKLAENVEALVLETEQETKSAEQDYHLQVKTPSPKRIYGTKSTQMTSKCLKREKVDKKIEHNLKKKMKKKTAKRRKSLEKSSKTCKKMKLLPLNPMLFFSRYPHITEKIFEKMNKDSLKSSRLVLKSWQNCIDNQNILWKKILEDEVSEKAFRQACKNGHVKMAKILIQKSNELNIDLNSIVKIGTLRRARNPHNIPIPNTAFHDACNYGHFKIVELLVHKSTEFNIDLNAKDKNGCTAFHYACEKSNFKLIELLVDKSAEFNIDINAKNEDGETGFHYACSIMDHSNIVEMLVHKSAEFKIDLNATNEFGQTGFHYACDMGHSKIVEILVQKSTESNIDVNAKEEVGQTGFHYACNRGHSKIVDILVQKSVESNIDINAKDDDGQTGFHCACDKGHSTIVEILVQKSAEVDIDFNAKDQFDKTGFHYACKNGDHEIMNSLGQIGIC